MGWISPLRDLVHFGSFCQGYGEVHIKAGGAGVSWNFKKIAAS
jgi:hypothetical protein